MIDSYLFITLRKRTLDCPSFGKGIQSMMVVVSLLD